MSIVIVLLCGAAFLAGFVDAVVGGGGLIQMPAAIVLLPQFPVANVMGSTKIPSFFGTSVAAYRYSRQVELNYKHLAGMMVVACLSAATGSQLLTVVPNGFMKPLLLVVLSVVAVYTFRNKNFGVHSEKDHTDREHLTYSFLIALIVGFYDGFVGPGGGSFFILALITLLGYDFLKASANAKFLNLATNFGSITFFILSGRVLWQYAIPMLFFNAAGGFLGAKLAILRGNSFIRIFFLTVIIATLIRFAWDVLGT